MSDLKKVSVIIPCYNCKDLIGETLDSLEKQTFKNFEVICVNDGSKDETLEYLNEQAKIRDLDIKIIDKENGGVSSARNAGIEVACGEYLLFLDADDVYNENFVEKLTYNADKYDTVYCKLNRDLKMVYAFNPQDVEHKEQTQKEAMHKLLYEMGNYGFYCYLYKKEILNKICLRFDENTRHFEDREFNWKYLANCNSILWLDAPLYGYRVNTQSVTQRPATWHTDGLDAIRRVEAYLKEKDCPFTSEVESYLFARAIWGLAKAYSISHKKDLFIRLKTEYELKKYMKRTAKDSNKLVKIASILYLINPMLFYYAVGSTKRK